jgi:hypothetical protein
MSAPYWAFLKKVYYPIDAIGINFDPLTSSNETKISNERMDKYLKILSLNDQVSLSTTPSLRIVQINKKDVLVDVKTDYAFDTLGVGEPVSDKLNASIQRYLQYQFLKSYVVNDTNYRIRVRFLPYVNGKVDTTLLSKKMVNGVYNIEEGDKIVVEVANLSKSPIFFNIIDLEPTGKINAIMPKKSSDVKKNIPANELTVPSGDTIIFHKFPVTIYKPYGNEVFKFFVSNQTLDLEYITTKSRDVKKDITSDLERVFRNSYKSGSRGDIGTRDGSVINVPFIIIPKNQ